MSQWTRTALKILSSDQLRTSDTHLYRLDIPALQGIDIYLKDESTHPTGSLKHRLARSLFLHAICSGKVREGTHVVEASSGSTAVSEAYFAKLLGLPFTAVMPASTTRSKITQVERLGGRCHFVDHAAQVYAAAEQLARETGGHYMDQFTYAERATDWRGNNNIAESIFRQLTEEPHPEPEAIVMSAGTGGTSATLGRYIRYAGLNTQLVVVDPENSVFYDSYQQRDSTLTSQASGRIEGIGRPQVEASFLPEVIDRMIKVPDAASIATIHWLEQILGRKAGGSTGTNLWGVLQLAQEMQKAGKTGSLVTLMCDGGERYLDTYYNAGWVAEHIGDITPWSEQLARLG
ncbi:PLP-dependent cysteine synthase family protein [Oceanimonas baumannii]|uniref:L-cysteine desulfhydrase Cds1 n=1 Tax=Oceanimonas baumannii TaxID=129578 RepID=A0A235CL80_9GAMM|nr:PLP-dependent cysteine synthase family protein [Oceanimonas baumannii]OYD25300.1 cysteine synthase [Oceanimonas baumannii]TDW62404.1 cysteine synthase A [Oceanimonas baumannii]